VLPKPRGEGLKATVQTEAQKLELKQTLAELESLHATEASALRRLSRDTLDELTDRKLQLWERLRAASAGARLGPDEQAALSRIKRAALHNQILLHHARDAVRSVLQAASGQQLPAPGNRQTAVQDGLRVDFRG
jgi:hypothetical protein